MSKPTFTVLPMPTQLTIDSTGASAARIAQLESQRSQWRRTAFRLADVLREIADHKGEDGMFVATSYIYLKAKAAAVLAELDLDGVER